MLDEKRRKRKIELNKKKSESGLTLTEAVELSMIERTDLEYNKYVEETKKSINDNR